MDTVKLLLEKGASAVSPIQSGATPMFMAVFMGAPRPDGRQSHRQFMMRVERPCVVIAYAFNRGNIFSFMLYWVARGLLRRTRCGAGVSTVEHCTVPSQAAWPGWCGVGHTQVVQALLKHGVDPQQIAPSHDLGCSRDSVRLGTELRFSVILARCAWPREAELFSRL